MVNGLRLIVQGIFGKPDSRECTVADFSDDLVSPMMKQIAKMNWMESAGTISLKRFVFIKSCLGLE